MSDLPASWYSLPWRPVAGATAAGTAALLCAALWPDSVILPLALFSGLALLAFATAHLFDEPAREVVRPTALTTRAWQLQRLSVALVPAATGCLALAVVNLRTPSFSWAGTTTVLMMLVAATAATASGWSRTNATPGRRVGESAALVVVATGLSDPLGRWVELLPVADDAGWQRTVLFWLLMGVLALGGLAWGRRDPAT